jgi:hypothetical protein
MRKKEETMRDEIVKWLTKNPAYALVWGYGGLQMIEIQAPYLSGIPGLNKPKPAPFVGDELKAFDGYQVSTELHLMAQEGLLASNDNSWKGTTLYLTYQLPQASTEAVAA